LLRTPNTRRSATMPNELRATLLGTGSPMPDPHRCGHATHVELGTERFLVDAGSGVGHQLVRHGVRPRQWPRPLLPVRHSDVTIDVGLPFVARRIVVEAASVEVHGPDRTRQQIYLLV